jgi:hypothetical protein
MSGEKIKEGNFDHTMYFETEGLTPGIYLVKISNGFAQETIRIFIGD